MAKQYTENLILDQLIALRIPLRIISHVISARALENARLGLAIEVNRHFLENECGDL